MSEFENYNKPLIQSAVQNSFVNIRWFIFLLNIISDLHKGGVVT